MISFEWIETPYGTQDGDPYTMFYMLHQSGRVLATIEGPTKRQVCYFAQADNRQDRRYISLKPAKEWAESEGRRILGDEIQQKALRRKAGAVR